MIRDLHPHTKPQRTTSPEHVDPRARELGYEPQDWPVAKIGKGLAVLFLVLGLVTMATAPLVRALGPDWHTSSALSAARRFAAPSPRLESQPRLDRDLVDKRALERLQRAPRSVDDAMREVAQQGWRNGGEAQ